VRTRTTFSFARRRPAITALALAVSLVCFACDRPASSDAPSPAESDEGVAKPEARPDAAAVIAPPPGYDLETKKPGAASLAAEDARAGANADLPALPPRAKAAPKVDPPAEILTTFEGSAVQREWLTYPDGSPKKLAYQRRNADGRLVDHGPDWRWFETGQIWIQRTWRDGKQNGPYAEWHQSGCEKQRGAFVDDQRDGHWLTWYETAAPYFDRGWKQGKLDGPSREWYPSGRLKVDSVWKDGVQDGPWRVFWASGQASQLGLYVNGARSGAWKEWAPDGTVTVAGNYVDGREDGPWLRTDEFGQRTEETYALGLLDGPRRTFDAQKHQLSQGNYVKGKAHGLQIEWYPGASKKSEIVYENGVQNGRVAYYFPDGKMQMQGSMLQGKRDGAWTYNKPDGTRDPERSGTYKDDQKIAD
jgi:antitoxin component YwqK of YwqJK toxin-antitoxin module